jgi:hypothetical protein
MREWSSSQPYAAGLDIRQAGVPVGEVSVSLHPDTTVGVRVRLAVFVKEGVATLSLPLAPLELRDLAGALRLAADQARRSQIGTVATSGMREAIDQTRGRSRG